MGLPVQGEISDWLPTTLRSWRGSATAAGANIFAVSAATSPRFEPTDQAAVAEAIQACPPAIDAGNVRRPAEVTCLRARPIPVGIAQGLHHPLVWR